MKPIHGMSNRPGTVEFRTYRAWQMLRQRCTNAHTRRYEDYGGLGVTYDPRWDSFQQFLDDVGLAPSVGHSIDRIKASDGYWPGNVKWSTRKEQQSNLKSNRWIEYKGEKLTHSDWAERLGITRTAFMFRVKKHGEIGAIEIGTRKTPQESANRRWHSS